MKSTLFTRKASLIVSLFVVLILFLSFVDPYDVPLFVLLVPFCLIFSLVYIFVYVGFSYVHRRRSTATGAAGSSSIKSRLVASITASTVVLALILQSIQQLTIRDVLLICALVAVVVFYLRRFN